MKTVETVRTRREVGNAYIGVAESSRLGWKFRIVTWVKERSSREECGVF